MFLGSTARDNGFRCGEYLDARRVLKYLGTEAAPSYPRKHPHLSGCRTEPPNALQQTPEFLMKNFQNIVSLQLFFLCL